MASRSRARKNKNTSARATSAKRGQLRVVEGTPVVPIQATEDHPSRWARPHVRTLAFASGKGGVGKSNLAANVAVALGEMGARVLLVDGDLAQANLDLLLGLNPRFDLQHVVSGEKSLDEIVVPGPRGVTLVPAASGVPALADLDDFRLEVLLRGLGNLEAETDLILIDVASGTSRPVLTMCLAVDQVVVVTTPEMPAFSDAYAMIKLLQQRGLTQPPKLVVNSAASAEEAEEVSHRLRLVARRFLKLEPQNWGYVPLDVAIPGAVRRQEPVVTAFPNSPAARAYRALAQQLWEVPAGPDATPRPLLEKLEA